MDGKLLIIMLTFPLEMRAKRKRCPDDKQRLDESTLTGLLFEISVCVESNLISDLLQNRYMIINLGKRPIKVDSQELQREEQMFLQDKSAIEMCGLNFMFWLR